VNDNAIKRVTRFTIVTLLTLTPNPLVNLLIMASNNPAGKPYDFGPEEGDKITPKKVTKTLAIVNISIGAPILFFKTA
jgi:hypothetical protein